jgi:hypothetical protein
VINFIRLIMELGVRLKNIKLQDKIPCKQCES